jgi:ATP-binding cassette subfamily C (CFTR/MRP) protein 10
MRHRLGQNLRAQFSSLACSQWLSVRIQLLGVAIVTCIAFASVLDVSLLRLANPGLIGLAITYALSLTNVLNGILTSFIETEKGKRARMEASSKLN